MKKRILLLGLVLVLSGCGAKDTEQRTTTESTTTEFSVETSQTSAEKSSADMAILSSDKLLDSFLAGEIPANYTEEGRNPFYITELTMDEEDFFSYKIGERIDLDNDGEKEQIIDGAYGGIYLDARDGAVYVLAQGDGTAAMLSYVNFDKKTWIVYSDTTHAGRVMYDFTLFDGTGQAVDQFGLYKEFWEYPNEPDGPNTIYTYRDKKITREEYDKLIEKIFIIGSSNNYFYTDCKEYTYNAKFAECEGVNEAAISVKTYTEFDDGVLYQLEIVCNKQVQDVYGDMLKLGYFLGTEDTIYKIDSFAVTNLTISDLDELIKHGTIVCQAEKLSDALSENEKGWHEYIEVNGNKREYHGYSNTGETNFYENFTWEEGKGLTYYRSGFGAESYGIELTLAE